MALSFAGLVLNSSLRAIQIWGQHFKICFASSSSSPQIGHISVMTKSVQVLPEAPGETYELGQVVVSLAMFVIPPKG